MKLNSKRIKFNGKISNYEGWYLYVYLSLSPVRIGQASEHSRRTLERKDYVICLRKLNYTLKECKGDSREAKLIGDQ